MKNDFCKKARLNFDYELLSKGYERKSHRI